MSDSTDKLVKVLEVLGSDGINAYYTYLFLDYGTFWLIVGLVTYGIRTIYARVKDDL